jgi:thiol-disulfide isomerase/thioredoxin
MPLAGPRVSNSYGQLLLASCALLCLLATTACMDNRVGQTPRGPNQPPTQLPLPPPNAVQGGDSVGFTLLDNRRMKLADYAGSVVLLDFYATWCEPCREETPHLVELHKRYNAQGLQIIGLNVGGAEDRDRVPAFIKEFQIPYALADPDTEMAKLYLSDDDKIPQAFVFDRQGRLVKRFIGYDAGTTPAELESLIKAQLAAQ